MPPRRRVRGPAHLLKGRRGRPPPGRRLLTIEVVMSRPREQTRDLAIWIVRLATFGGVASALGLTWLFSDMAQAYFSGQPAPTSPSVPPNVPVEAVPVQKAPPVVQTVVHHPYQGTKAPAP